MDNNIFATKKLIIGPALVFTDHMLLGYPMESIKIIKQANGQSYSNVLKNMWSKGFFSGFYTAYLRAGLPQIYKGAPLLFAQQTSMNIFKKYGSKNFNDSNMKHFIAGSIGGAFQGVCITPFQRWRTIASTSNISNISSTNVVKGVIKKEGVMTLFRGIGFTLGKRSIDWGIRFGIKNEIQQRIIDYKSSSSEVYRLTLYEKMFSGMIAGMVSIVSQPFDVCIALSQKYTGTSKKKSSIDVIKEQYKKYGYRGFTHG